MLRLFSKAKTEECEQKISNVFDQFGITIPCLVIYFLEVGACVSVKVGNKGSIKDITTLKT